MSRGRGLKEPQNLRQGTAGCFLTETMAAARQLILLSPGHGVKAGRVSDSLEK